jgi:dipeptidyl aminopeptidase/acylaminoacyl peptidase
MRFIRVLLALAVVGFGAAQAQAAAPLEAYGGLPNIESIEISPDGARLAVVASTGEQRIVLIKQLADGTSTPFAVGDAKVRGLNWVGPEHLIITTSRTGQIADVSGPRREHWLAFDLNLTTRKLTPLLKQAPGRAQTGTFIRDNDTGRAQATLNTLAGAPEVRLIDGAPTLFLPGVSFPDRMGVLTIFQVDLRNGNSHFVEVGDRYTSEFVLGQQGEAIAKASYEPESGRWTLRLRQGSDWKESRVLQAKTEPPTLVGLGRDGGSVLVAEMGETGFVLREVSPAGVWGEPLEVKDADGPIFDPVTHRLIGLYALVGDDDVYTFFDPADQKAWNSVRAAFKGERVRLESWSQDRKKLVVLVDSPTQGSAYAMVDLTTKRANWLGGRYQKLKQEDISPVQPVRFKAADGLELTGYLTTPYGKPAKNLPLVVLPHGGPAARDTPGFDWWAQALASRGYAVLQVNYRGSDGFGWSFVKAGFGEWGRKMQTDLSDGVRHLAAQGVIDPKRVCIVGGSYGGYAALAGATLDPGVYRCAASIAGISDMRRFVDWTKGQNGRYAFRYWNRFAGSEDSRDPVLGQISPAAHVDARTIPVLLVHGRDDTVVPLEQSRIMADALQKAGRPADLVVLSGEDHWLSQGDTRTEMLQAVVAFLEKNNPP